MNRTYTGPALEQGGTSIRGRGPAPFVRQLAKTLEPGTTILDYGAGKFARNADYLRGLGFKVYAYDPFNANGSNGYGMGCVSNRLPANLHFDLGLTCYVLNVVPEHVEDKILSHVRRHSSRQVHITRGTDIIDSVHAALKRGDKTVSEFFEREYLPGRRLRAPFQERRLDLSQALDFCRFGAQTSKGFQRLPNLGGKGYGEVTFTHGYRVFDTDATEYVTGPLHVAGE